MKKILGITGIRSDYDLMSSLYKLLAKTSDVDFKLLVGGAHLSKTYGHSIDLIQNDGIPILMSVESLIDGDSPSSRIKTASIMLQNVIDCVVSWSPDIIVYAGDREEVWIGALLGTYLGVPTVHFYGGDHTTTGHVDNPVRHATSKLSSAHFVAIEEHKSRLMAMGEDNQRIFVTGNLSLDNFVVPSGVSFVDLKKKIGLPSNIGDYAIVLFHPDPSETESSARCMENILNCLSEKGLFACVGYPNTDPANREIIRVIEHFSDKPDVFIYQNLDRNDFIALYKNARFIIGNSSSGILEAASSPLPAINDGVRQRGRLAGENVVFCDGDKNSIFSAIELVESIEFREELKFLKNLYGDGQSAKIALDILLSMDFNALRLKTEDPLKLL